MKPADLHYSSLKYKLMELRRKGEKRYYMVLNADEVEYVSKFFNLKPYNYRVTLNFSRKFTPKDAPPIVKRLYDMSRYRHPGYRVTIKLNDYEVKQLKNAGLRPVPNKYCIFLK